MPPTSSTFRQWFPFDQTLHTARTTSEILFATNKIQEIKTVNQFQEAVGAGGTRLTGLPRPTTSGRLFGALVWELDHIKEAHYDISATEIELRQ